MFDFRTDLADERTEICKKQVENGKIDGIESINNVISDKIEINIVKVLNEEGSKKIQKRIGTYTTINIKNIEIITKDEIEEASKLVSKELQNLITDQKPILIVGLGNEDTTADSLRTKSY